MADPIRTCIVTRQRHPREALVRLVASPDGEVVVDAKARLPGRGVWVHPDHETLARLASKAGPIQKSLGVPIDAAAIRVAIEEATSRAVADGISLAAASGALVLGQERLITALGQPGVVQVGVASDVAERTLRHVVQAAGGVPVVRVPWTADALGQRIGKSATAVFGVTSSRACAHLRRHLERWKALRPGEQP